MKRCLPHNATDNRNKNRGKQRGIAALCALSLCVALGAFTVLSAPAIALTEDKAEELGIELAAEATPETAAVAPLAETEQAPAALLTGDMSVTLNKVDAETGAETPDATITLTCTEDAAVPAEATLDVRELEPGSDEYNEYYDQTVQALVDNGMAAAAEEVHVTHARLFDVNILVAGEKFEPAAPVEVNITYAEPTATAEDNTERKVVHFATEDDGTETPEVLDTEVIKAEDGTEVVKYEQGSFSPAADIGFFIMPRGLGEPVDIGEGTTHDVTVTSDVVGAETYDRNAKFNFEMGYHLTQDEIKAADYKGYYDLPAELTNVISSVGTDSGIIWKGNINIGTYTVEAQTDGHYRVLFDYTNHDYIDTHDDFQGTFKFNGSIKTTVSDNLTKVEVEFPGTTTPIEIKLESGKVTGRKTHTINTDGTIEFTITFTVTGEDSTVKLTDTLGSNLSFIEGGAFTLDGTTTVTPAEKEGQTAKFELGELSIGTHTLTYKVQVDDPEALDNTKNSINWDWETKSDSEGHNNFEDTVTFNKSGLSKSGNYDATSGKIYWTVLVSPSNFGNVSEVILTDVLGGTNQKYEPDGSYTLTKQYDGTPVASGSLSNIQNTDGTQLTYKLPAGLEDGVNYEFKYCTVPTGELNDTTPTNFTNNVSDDKGHEGGGNVGVYPGGGSGGTGNHGNTIATKDGTVLADNKIWWSIAVDPGKYTGTGVTDKTLSSLVLKDELGIDGTGEYDKTSLSFVSADGSPLALVEDTDYTIVWDETVTTKPSFTLTFINIPEGAFVVKYLSVNGTSGKWQSNTVNSSYTIGGTNDYEKDTTSKQVETKGYPITKDGLISGSLENGKISWTITVDCTNPQYVLKDLGVYTVTDTLPDGLTYVDGTAKYTLTDAKWDQSNDVHDAELHPTVAGRVLSFDIPVVGETNGEGKGALPKITITFDTAINNPLPTTNGNGFEKTDDAVTFHNDATFGKDNVVYGKAEADAELNLRAVNKTAEVLTGEGDPPNTIRYDIEVNAKKQDLSTDSDIVTLYDKMDSNITLNTGTAAEPNITVTDWDTGASVAFTQAYEILSDGSKLTLTVPDEQHLKVSYTVTVQGTKDQVVTAVNEAWLKGLQDKVSHTEDEVKIKESSATITGSGLTLEKVDSSDTTIVLEGAKFELYKISSIPELTFTKLDRKNNTTDDSGELSFNAAESSSEEELATDTLYYFIETQAPGGYELSATEHYFVIRGTDVAATTAYVAKFNGTALEGKIALYAKDSQILFPNTPRATPSYTLPETGGAGTAPYLFGGLVLMGVGALGLRKKRKAER